MDIVERTGSGLYDVELKARLGDLSGLANTDLVHGRSNPGFGLATDNVYLQGGIIATFGEIGGFSIDTNTISSSNNNLILRDNGQITGSNVLLDGGTIGGFDMGADIISSSNGNLVFKSNGQITGSNVLLDGGVIGGFDLGNNIISSSNGNLVLNSNGQITGSNVLLDGGTIGGFSITDNAVSSSQNIANLGTPLALKRNGEITGSNVIIRQRIGSTNYTLLDTSNGIVDARNVGRQVVFDSTEYSQTGETTGGDWQTKASWVFPILPNETNILTGFHMKTSVGGASAMNQRVRFLFESGSQGIVNTHNNYDSWDGGQATPSVNLSTNSAIFPNRSYAVTPDNAAYNNDIPDGFEGKLCRVSLQFKADATSGTPNLATQMFVKYVSLVTTREFSADFADAQSISNEPPAAV